MDLSSELISQFVKATKDVSQKISEATIYGTTVEYNGTIYVKLDGSERLTPVDTTVALEPNERVTVLVKDHTATVTGNISSPAARNTDVEAIKGTIAEFDTVIADKIDAKTANIELAIIDKLDGKYATFDAIEVAEADIDILKADNVTINQKLTARDAEIDQLKADSLTVQVADAKYATIDNLTGTNAKLNNLESTYGEFKIATVDRLDAIEADIADLDVEKLDAKYATVTRLEAAEAEIDTLQANMVVADDLQALEANIANLQANKLSAKDADLKYATIAVLQSDYITADEIAATYITASAVAANYAKISTLESDYIKTTDLEANYITAAMINSKYAEIDLANVDKASIGTVLANIGLITTATIVDGHVTGYLDSVEVNANNITAGTLTVDRLIISGSDKSIIYAINNAGELTSTEADTINGDVITKRTIAADHIVAGAITANEIHSSAVTADKIATNAVTADKIAANAITSGKIAANAITADKIAADSITADKIKVVDLKALDATIGAFNIGDNSIYSGTKSTVNNTSRGIYMDTDGQMNLGDSNNYLKYYKDQNGNYKLDITAESLKFGSGTSVKDAIEEVQTSANNAQTVANNAQNTANTANTTANNAVDKVNNLQVGGRNLLRFTGELPIGTTRNDGVYSWVGNTVLTKTTNGIKLSFTTVGEDCIGLSLANDGIVKSGDTLTLSFDYRGTITNFGAFYFIQRTPPNTSLRGFPSLVANETEWQHYEHTFTATNANSGTCYSILMFYGASKLTTDWIEIKKGSLKLEKGNKATDWTPAPEDTVSKVDVMYAQNASSTTAPTSGWATTAPTWIDGQYIWTKTVTTYGGNITSESAPVCITGAKGTTGAAGSAGATGVGISSITELYYAGPTTTAPSAPTAAVTTNNASTYVSWNKAMPTYSASYPHYFTCSQVYYTDGTYKWTTPVYAGALTSANATANSAVNTVNNLSIGGRNLFKGYGEEEIRLNDYQNVGGFTQFSNHLTFDPSETVGETYTISFWAKSPNGKTALQIYNSNGNPRYFRFWHITLTENLGNEWRYFTLTIQNTDMGESYSDAAPLCNRIEIYAPSQLGVLVKKIKVEKGNKATDWSPAPEDVASDISSAQSTANSAQSTANTANSTANTALGRVTIKDTRNDNQNPQWYISNYPKQIVQEFKLASSIGLSGETYAMLETTVPWGDSSGGFPKQVAKINGKQYWRVGTSNTTWSAWNDPGATATNFMSFDSTNGLVVSQDATANAGNVQIKSDGFRIRNGTTVNASFLGNTITLGQNSSDSYINLCGDKGTIHVGDKDRYDGTATDALYIDSEDITLYGEYSISSILHSPLTSGLTTTALGYMHVTSSLTSVSGTNVYLPEIHLGTITNDTELGQVSTLLALSRNSATLSYDNNGIWCQSDGVHVKAYNGDRVFLSVYDSEIDPYIDITPSTSTATTRIYMAARNINIDAINMTTIDSPATVNGLLTANGSIRLPNGVVLEGLNKAGLSRGLIHYATDNSTYVGYGGYANSEGCHYVCGNEIRFLTRASTSSFVPYYKAGDSISLVWTGSGFITNGSSDLQFTIPLSKPAIGISTVTITSVDGLTVRQTDKYLYGSTASASAIPSSYSATLRSNNCINVTAHMPNTTNVVNNNDSCGVRASIKITFS